MRVARIYVDQPLAGRAEIQLDQRAARHVLQVLRLKPKQIVTLFNGDGCDWQAELVRCDRSGVYTRLSGRRSVEPGARLAIHLGIGISRGERMDYAIQKAVELGVAAITALRTERTVVQLDAQRAARRAAHWQGIVISACEQSGRSRLPTMHPIRGLADWLRDCPSGLLLDHRAPRTLAGLAQPPAPINLLVGPEGGLASHERDRAEHSGFVPVRIGPRVLRTETAPLAAIAAIQALWGDFRD